MPAICLYFKVHQPWRLKSHIHIPHHGVPDQKLMEHYFEVNGKDKRIFERAARKCYYPTNDILLEAIDEFRRTRRKFKLAFSFTGTFIEQCERFDSGVVESFRNLVDTGCVEVLGETYYHSLASIFPETDEFIDQVNEHRELIKSIFGKKPKVFVNTEALYNNRIASIVEDMGFSGIMTEGVDHVLGWRSPNYLYRPPEGVARIPILLRNYRLSDDVSYRFSARWWDQWPLTADKYASWLAATPGDVINLFMDYETFGEHQWPETGIYSFLRHLPIEVLKYRNLRFLTPSEVIKKFKPVGEFDIFDLATISWADMERDTSAWLGNWMQQVAHNELILLEPFIKRTGDPNLLKTWRLLQVSDHLYYMCDKGWGDGDVHTYFSNFNTPGEAFMSFMNVISDLKRRTFEKLSKRKTS
ncbi:MAG: alpha-amylase [Candidatus Aenigmatarchaeota archaeon]|nr:MAG: alpha-amylase [Candidatus Aenigmarchaeota archaeon]